MRRFRRLPRTFFSRPTLTVAEELIGKHLVCANKTTPLVARIVEVEAYVGEDDPASHAAPGLTERNTIMYGPAGHAYIYLIYGMYNCLNVVTEQKGFPAAILLRAGEPVEGTAFMRKRSGKLAEAKMLSGPGRLCRAMGLTTRESGMDMCGEKVWIEDRGGSQIEIVRTPRIGISKATDRLWRLCDPESLSLSQKIATKEAGK